MINTRKYLSGAFVVLTVGLLVWGLIGQWDRISIIFSFIFYGVVIAYLMLPASRWLERFMSRSIAVILLFSGIIMIMAIFFLWFIPTLYRQITALVERLPGFTSKIKTIIGNLQVSLEQTGLPYSIQMTLGELAEGIEERLVRYFRESMDGVLDGVGRMAGFLTIPVLSFYFIKDREYFRKMIIGLIPAKARGSVLQISSEVNQILHQFIRGQLLIGMIVGILTTIGYWIIGLPYAMVLGLVAAVFEIIPYFGPFLGAAPALVVALLNSPSKLVWTIIVVVVAQQLESGIFTPKIMGDHVGLHPVYIVIVLWLGGMFFGMLGMLFAVPSVLILRIILKSIYMSIVSAPWNLEK